MRSWLSVLITDAESKKVFDIPIAPSLYSLSNKMDNFLLAVRDINHKYIVVDYIPDDPTEIKYVDEVLKLLNVLTGDKRYEKIFQKKKGVRSMCDVAERLEKMGIVKGIEIGRLEGKKEGKAEGKAEGILEGKMQVYRNLLKKGFTEKEAREITEIS
jgi:hypothetical protein